MQDNPSSAQEVTFTPAKSSWFNKRPIPVFIISAWCIIQFIVVTLFILDSWHEIIELVKTGAESPLSLIGKFLNPFIMFIAGILLLFMRKSATIAFGLYLASGLIWQVTQSSSFQGYLPLAIVLLVFVYCLNLKQSGKLS